MSHRLNVQIGSESWAEEIRKYTDSFDRLYWTGFTPWTDSELNECEAQINRKLPNDFRLFVLHFGSGAFRNVYGGDIYSSAEITIATPGPFWMILGSSNWATEEEHRRMYTTHGRYNPLFKHMAESEFIHDGVSLFDLLQIGTDGNCCYHQINVGNPHDKMPFGYCLLTSDPTFENKLPSFSAGLSLLLSFHEASARGDEEAVYLRDYGRTELDFS